MNTARGCSDALQSLRTTLKGYDSVAVAFSGGVDSTLLLQIALMTLGPERVLALYARSALVTEDEQARALSWLHTLEERCQLRYLIVDWLPLSIDFIRQNSEMRCYYCKRHMFSLLQQVQRQRGVSQLIDGTNADDVQEHRPGLRAARELAVHRPLADAGCTKACIRSLSRRLGLATWNMPSASCLATRIPAGTALSLAQLHLTAQLERIVETQGFPGCRVRLSPLQPQSVLVELDPAHGDALGPALQTVVQQAFMQHGIQSVTFRIAQKSRLS